TLPPCGGARAKCPTITSRSAWRPTSADGSAWHASASWPLRVRTFGLSVHEKVPRVQMVENLADERRRRERLAFAFHVVSLPDSRDVGCPARREVVVLQPMASGRLGI